MNTDKRDCFYMALDFVMKYHDKDAQGIGDVLEIAEMIHHFVVDIPKPNMNLENIKIGNARNVM